MKSEIQLLAKAKPPKMSTVPWFSSRMRRYNMVARLNSNFEEVCRTGNIYLQGSRKLLKAKRPKCNNLGNFHSPTLRIVTAITNLTIRIFNKSYKFVFVLSNG